MCVLHSQNASKQATKRLDKTIFWPPGSSLFCWQRSTKRVQMRSFPAVRSKHASSDVSQRRLCSIEKADETFLGLFNSLTLPSNIASASWKRASNFHRIIRRLVKHEHNNMRVDDLRYVFSVRNYRHKMLIIASRRTMAKGAFTCVCLRNRYSTW